MKKVFNRFENPCEGISLLGIAKAAVAACGKDWNEVRYISFEKKSIREEMLYRSYFDEYGMFKREHHYATNEYEEKTLFNFTRKDFESACGNTWIHPFAAKNMFCEDDPYRPDSYRPDSCDSLYGKIYGSNWSIGFDEAAQKWTLREEELQYGKHSCFNEEFFELVTEFVMNDEEYAEEHYPSQLEKEKNSWLYRNYILLRAIFLSKSRKSPLAVKA